MYTVSPLISNGQLSLTNTGDLVTAPDIQTQMTVTLTAYNCIYDYTIKSALITYLRTIPVGGFNANTIKNIITSAYQTLIQQSIITNLQIAVIPITSQYITINITADDAQGMPIVLTWDNSTGATSL